MKTLSPSFPAVLFASVLALSLAGCPEQKKPPVIQEPVDAGFDAGVVEELPEEDAGTSDGGEPIELKITRVLPARGGTSGGNYVTIEGAGFVAGFAQSPTAARKETTITFAGNPAQDFQIISDSVIDVRVPPGVAGSALVKLDNPNGSYPCNGCYRYYEELFLQDAQPRNGPQRGGTEVVLTGSGFDADTRVLFGQSTAAGVTFVSSNELRAIAPKSLVSGPVDVIAYNQSGVSSIRNGFRYDAEVKVLSLDPTAGFVAGGETVKIHGAGFTGATEVRFGSELATGLTVIDGTVIEVVSPASAAGSVDVTVVTPTGTFVARDAYTYVGNGGSLALRGVSPRIVPSVNPGVVTVFGEGLDGNGLTISIDGVPVTILSSGENFADVIVPDKGVDAIVDIAATTSSGSDSLNDALTYRIELTSIIPFEGPQSGGTASTLLGDALPASAKVFIGPNEAVGTTWLNDEEINFTTPPGGGGSVDVWVYDANDPENEAYFTNGFIYDEPLDLGAVLPTRGAIAGNTLVQVLGSGFREGITVSFGGEKAKDLEVINSHLVMLRAPKAAGAGPVDVTVRYLGESDVLTSAYSYFDPKSVYGGSSGGPFVGTLNVSVLESARELYGQPVPLARVMIGNDGATPFQGFTDSRGQVTISDQALVKAQTVTIFKDGYESVTVSGVTSENLTVYVGRTGGGGGGGGGGGEPAPFSVIEGAVTGFKAPYPLSQFESLEARVYVAQDSLYSGWPWTEPQRFPEVEIFNLTNDGAKYLVISRPGLRAVYAILGVKNSLSGGFTPYLMGIKRNINADAYDQARDNRMRGNDIQLDMHLDLDVEIQIDGAVSSYGLPAQNVVFSWIDLGAEGYIPNFHNEEMLGTTATEFDFRHHPRLDGSNFIFMNLAMGGQTPSGASAYSIFYRRQPGDLSQGGITLGPLLPLPQIDRPSATFGFNGIIGWTHDRPGPTPDIHNVTIERPGNPPVAVWSVVMPGYETSVTLPPAATDKLRREEAGGQLSVTVNSSRSPKFAYSQWTYDSLSALSWTAFTMAFSEPFFP